MINRVIVSGRLVKDPEVKVLANGSQIAVFSVAVNHRYRNKNGEWIEKTDYIDLVAYGKLAEKIGLKFNKGYLVTVEGKLRQKKWQSSNGQKKSKIEIVVNKISLLSKPKTSTVKSKTEKVAS